MNGCYWNVCHSYLILRFVNSKTKPNCNLYGLLYFLLVNNFLILIFGFFCCLTIVAYFFFLLYYSHCFQITLPYDTQQLHKATRDTAAIYLACGVDTSKVGCVGCVSLTTNVEVVCVCVCAFNYKCRGCVCVSHIRDFCGVCEAIRMPLAVEYL